MMFFKRPLAFLFTIMLLNFSCSKEKPLLKTVSFEEYEVFVSETNYVTDAERYGWSVVQIDVFNFKKVDGATWRKPDGINTPVSKNLPVTQVSYNDAFAYCAWAGKRLPTYKEYWDFVKSDKRVVVADNLLPISEVGMVNVLGNVWDITATEDGKPVRLAGGSVFCSPSTCHGTVEERALYVDAETGNIHIGFSILD